MRIEELICEAVAALPAKIKSAMRKIILYSLVFIFGFIGVSLWSFWLVVRPPKIVLNNTPSDFNLPAEDTILKTSDGLELSAWFIAPESLEKKQAIILLHGYPVEKSDMLDIASSLYPDFALLLLDLRYFGKSQGHYTTLGVKEKLDLVAGLDFLESKGYEQIGVFGFSLGGATAMLTAVQDSRIDALASCAAFSDLRTLGYEAYSKLFVLKYPLVELMLIWSRILFGESVLALSPLGAAKNINIPVFIIHTKEDEQISFSHPKRLKEALVSNEKAEFYFPETGLHGELPLDFNTRLKNFFERVLNT
jgi:dipeptidyl aminopeptidase/acylaminoacyl peptidase